MRRSLRLLVLLAAPLSLGVLPKGTAYAQQHFDNCITNVNNATAQLPADVESSFGAGAALEAGDEIALFTNDGTCAGVVVWDGANTSVSAAGADSQQPEGYEPGEPLRFVVWDASTDAEHDVDAAYQPCGDDASSLCRDDGLYAHDALYRVAALNAQPLPVELAAFDVALQGEAAFLEWRTASETNNAGFYVEHRAPGSAGEDAWQTAGFVEGQGTTTQAQTYTHRVDRLAPGVHRFRLQQVDFDGAFEYSPTVEVSVKMDQSHRLAAPHPNPFSARTRFALSVGRAQHVRVAVYNVLGQEVALLHDGALRANTAHAFDFSPSALPSGVYLIRAAGEFFSETQRVVHVR